MMEIPLTQGQVAIVDAADYEYLNQWRWYALWAPNTQSYYAVRYVPRREGPGGRARMHRVILGLHSGDPLQGDHINGITLDNRRANLRVATRTENSRNQRLQRKSTSGYKGVTRYFGIWRAQIKICGKKRHLGVYTTPVLAHAAYMAAAKQNFGEFASEGVAA